MYLERASERSGGLQHAVEVVCSAGLRGWTPIAFAQLWVGLLSSLLCSEMGMMLLGSPEIDFDLPHTSAFILLLLLVDDLAKGGARCL